MGNDDIFTSKLGRRSESPSIPVDRVVLIGVFTEVSELIALEAACAAAVKLFLGNRRSIK